MNEIKALRTQQINDFMAGFDNLKDALGCMCGNLMALLPVVSMLMVIGAGVVYAAGQMMGAETRARANTWATAMLVGAIIGYSLAVVNNSYATGNIYGENQIGGLVGWQVSDDFTAIVENSYSRVNIDGNQNISGLVGVNGHDIKNSYSTGNVKCNALCDGLTSSGGASSSVLNSFWDINSSNQSSSGAGTGKTTQEMKLLGTFSSWNIEYNETDLNDGYPYLAWELNKSSPIWLIPEEGIPLIETLELNEINYSSATLRGDLIYLGSYCEGEIYFNYSEDNETWNSTEKETISEEEIYTKEITSLIIDFEYFYKICIDFESETLCGETLTFETSTPFLLKYSY